MSNNRFVWQGMEEFKRALRALPNDLAGEAMRVVEASANGAALEIRTAYGQHVVTGNLQEHVEVDIQRTGLNVSAVVKATARHSHLFEYGTEARHYFTKKRGIRHETGKMWGKQPGGFVFVPIVIKARRRMYERIIDIMKRAGLTVTGRPNA